MTNELDEQDDHTGVIPDVTLEHAAGYLPLTLLVDGILKPESREDAAMHLIELITVLTKECDQSERVKVAFYAKAQAWSYRPEFLQVLTNSLKMVMEEIARRQKRRR